MRLTGIPGATISGRVVGADGHAAFLEDVGLYLLREDGGPVEGALGPSPAQAPSWATTTIFSEDATFEFRGVPSGRYRILVDGYPPADGAGQLVEAGDQDVLVRLAPLCTLTLRFVDSEGRPIPGLAEVSEFHAGEYSPRKFAEITTGTGVIRFGAMDHGWLGIFPEGGCAKKLLDMGRWDPGEEREIVVQLEPGRRVVLRFPSGLPVEMVVPAAVSEEDPRRNLVFPGYVQEGVCVLEGASRGAFTMIALDADGSPLGPPLTVPAGDSDLELSWDPKALPPEGGNR